MTPVWLFVPNLIGYVRLATAVLAATVGVKAGGGATGAFFAFYGVSYLLDAVDGVAARALGQTSRFGAVLDMVTDRISTAVLLALLAHQCMLNGMTQLAGAYLLFLMLDVGAHWVQMYSALAGGAASHKSLADEPPLLKWYYRRGPLFTVCLFNEAHLVAAFLLARAAHATPAGLLVAPFMLKTGASPVALLRSLGAPAWLARSLLPLVPANPIGTTVAAWLYAAGAGVFALKQFLSVLQLVRASQRIVGLDEADRRAALAAKRAAAAARKAKKAAAAAAAAAASAAEPEEEEDVVPGPATPEPLAAPAPAPATMTFAAAAPVAARPRSGSTGADDAKARGDKVRKAREAERKKWEQALAAAQQGEEEVEDDAEEEQEQQVEEPEPEPVAVVAPKPVQQRKRASSPYPGKTTGAAGISRAESVKRARAEAAAAAAPPAAAAAAVAAPVARGRSRK